MIRFHEKMSTITNAFTMCLYITALGTAPRLTSCDVNVPNFSHDIPGSTTVWPCDTAGCDHYCHMVNGTALCSCRRYMVLDPDGTTCKYPCELAACSDGCENVNTHAMCTCEGDRVLDNDGVTCTRSRPCASSNETSVNNNPSSENCTYECHVIRGENTCVCPPDKILGPDGATCRQPCEMRHLQGGCDGDRCVNRGRDYECICFTGEEWNSQTNSCSTEKLICRDAPCQYRCEVIDGNAVCACPSHLILDPDGVSCKSACDYVVCPHTCTDVIEDYIAAKCDCNDTEWTIARRNNEGSPCNYCEIINGTATCSCGQHLMLADHGNSCTDPCTPNPCGPEQTCSTNGAHYWCSCFMPSFFKEGKICRGLKECEWADCAGTCQTVDEFVFDGMSLHRREHGIYKCSCEHGRLGKDGQSCIVDGVVVTKPTGGPSVGSRPTMPPVIDALSIRSNYTAPAGDTLAGHCTFGSCLHDSKCINKENHKHTCECSKYYRGPRCEEKYDPCQKVTCHNGGTCKVLKGNRVKCQCKIGYKGEFCVDIDPTCGRKCGSHGHCSLEGNEYVCECEAGFDGERCQINVDECVSSPCENGTCVDKTNGYQCSCSSGFTGRLCETHFKPHPCRSSPCANGGTCVSESGQYRCICNDKFTGVNCDSAIIVDPCLSNPCGENGTCQRVPCEKGDNCSSEMKFMCTCSEGYTGITCDTKIKKTNCSGEFGKFDNCSCLVGYTGKDCATEINECDTTSCGEHGVCADLLAGYMCNCDEGHDGRHCEIDIDECISYPCQNGGSCVDQPGKFMCECRQGFEGTTCEMDIDECRNNPCNNGGTCINTVGSHKCRCANGYDGFSCDVDINECLSAPCHNGGRCRDLVASYDCSCVDNFIGRNCDSKYCDSRPCKNGGTCADANGGFFCQCTDEFTGKVCDTKKVVCESQPCLNNGRCEEDKGRFDCKCQVGFIGKKCEFEINECSSNPCGDNGVCKDSIGRFTCACVTGYTGEFCQERIDYCRGNPCLNNGTCVSKIGRRVCLCRPGYCGGNCGGNINECASTPCRNGGRCVDGINRFTCICTRGTMGRLCTDVARKCSLSVCKNNATCVENKEGATCVCPSGFTGKTCNWDIDECASMPCKNGGFCLDLENSYKCKCTAGFMGVNCQRDNNECASSPCQNKGTCVDGINTFTCICPPGLTDVFCSTNIDECQSHPCQNGGICMDRINGYACDCPKAYTGRLCGVQKDFCVNSPCPPQKKCVSSRYGYECFCPSNKQGKHCEFTVDFCVSSPCKNGGVCKASSFGFTCHCQGQYLGKRCDVEYCSVNQCQHNGTCVITHRGKGYQCMCEEGFRGPQCEVNHDECASSPCSQGYCIDGANAYRCSCVEGYHGTHCDKTYPCMKNYCYNQGTCLALPEEGFKCLCTDGYGGVDCRVETCDLIDCGPHGKCEEFSGMFRCRCMVGVTGTYCDERQDTEGISATTEAVFNFTTYVSVGGETIATSDVTPILACVIGACVVIFGIGLVILCCKWRLQELKQMRSDELSQIKTYHPLRQADSPRTRDLDSTKETIGSTNRDMGSGTNIGGLVDDSGSIAIDVLDGKTVLETAVDRPPAIGVCRQEPSNRNQQKQREAEVDTGVIISTKRPSVAQLSTLSKVSSLKGVYENVRPACSVTTPVQDRPPTRRDTSRRSPLIKDMLAYYEQKSKGGDCCEVPAGDMRHQNTSTNCSRDQNTTTSSSVLHDPLTTIDDHHVGEPHEQHPSTGILKQTVIKRNEKPKLLGVEEHVKLKKKTNVSTSGRKKSTERRMDMHSNTEAKKSKRKRKISNKKVVPLGMQTNPEALVATRNNSHMTNSKKSSTDGMNLPFIREDELFNIVPVTERVSPLS